MSHEFMVGADVCQKGEWCCCGSEYGVVLVYCQMGESSGLVCVKWMSKFLMGIGGCWWVPVGAGEDGFCGG